MCSEKYIDVFTFLFFFIYLFIYLFIYKLVIKFALAFVLGLSLVFLACKCLCLQGFFLLRCLFCARVFLS